MLSRLDTNLPGRCCGTSQFGTGTAVRMESKDSRLSKQICYSNNLWML